MKNLSRRKFIKAAGLGAAALALPKLNFASALNYIPTAKIGIQLYTVRNEIEKNFEETIRKIADMGYAGVETYFFPENISMDYAGKILRKYKLEVLGSHCELPVGKDRDTILKMATAYNTDRMVYHGWPQDDKYKGLDAIKHTATVYNKIGRFANRHGLLFGLHNHWWEFQENDGFIPFYYLLEHLDENIFFEIDTYWAKTAGLDPAQIIKDFGRRAPLLHIKDGPATKGVPVHKQAVLGNGTQDFKAIAEASGRNVKWMIVEFDEYEGNIFDAVEKSFNYLETNNFADGRI